MPDQDEATTLGVGVAIGVAVIFTVLFVLGLLCGVLGLVVEGSPFQTTGHESTLWLAATLLLS